jgi:hypothetical protein
VERIELTYEYGVQRRRKWRNAVSGSAFLIQVTVGQLRDGRWFAQCAGYGVAARYDGEAAYVFDNRRYGERLAVQLAYRWMRELGGGWEPAPARYSPDGSRPDDGLPWRRSGGGWVLDRR